jgi:hypothetical protein
MIEKLRLVPEDETLLKKDIRKGCRKGKGKGEWKKRKVSKLLLKQQLSLKF